MSREMDLKTKLRNILKEHESKLERFIEVKLAQSSGQDFLQQEITTHTNGLVTPATLCKTSCATTRSSTAAQQSKPVIVLIRKSTITMSLQISTMGPWAVFH